jgi:hypothetical protein
MEQRAFSEAELAHVVSKLHFPLFNPNYIQKSYPLNPAMNKINPVHIFTSYLIKIHFNFILSYTLSCPILSPLLRYFDQNFIRPSHVLIRATCSVNLIFFDSIILIMSDEYILRSF